jgi:hypothetical protein
MLAQIELNLPSGDSSHALLRPEITTAPELQRGIPLADGTFLLQATQENIKNLNRMPVGTHFTWLKLSAPLPESLNEPQQYAMLNLFKKRETVAILYSHNPQAYRATPSKDVWGTIRIGEEDIHEKTVAVSMINHLFDTTKGIEGSVVAVAGLGQLLGADVANKSIAKAGCDLSHNAPLIGSQQSLEARALNQGDRFLTLKTDQTVYFRVGSSNGSMVGLETLQLLDGEPLLNQTIIQSIGLLALSKQIAKQNPTNMGRGTTEQEVRDAAITTLQQIAIDPEREVAALQQDFAQKLGVRNLPMRNG